MSYVGAGGQSGSYIGNPPITETAGTRREWTPTNGQTTFTIQYAVGYLDVFVNGAKLGSADFTATNGTSFTLTSAVTDQDLVAAIAWAKGDMLPVDDYYDKAGVEERSNTKRRAYVHIQRTAAAPGNVALAEWWPIMVGPSTESVEVISGSQDLVTVADFLPPGVGWTRRLTVNAESVVVPSITILTTANISDVFIGRYVNGSYAVSTRFADLTATHSATLGPFRLASGSTFFSSIFLNQAAAFGFATGTALGYEVIEV